MSQELVKQICKALADKKADGIKIISIKGMTDIADYFVICSGRSAPQVKAILDNLEEKLELQGVFAKRKEGVAEGKWIAIDYQEVIVHIFHHEIREIYQLDRLWNSGNNVVEYAE
ncbi:MAG: ribosome silencing factor [Clostridia bacterium]|nr:ribosome silencing factor [Clostridia bacterium]